MAIDWRRDMATFDGQGNITVEVGLGDRRGGALSNVYHVGPAGHDDGAGFHASAVQGIDILHAAHCDTREEARALCEKWEQEEAAAAKNAPTSRRG